MTRQTNIQRVASALQWLVGEHGTDNRFAVTEVAAAGHLSPAQVRSAGRRLGSPWIQDDHGAKSLASYARGWFAVKPAKDEGTT